MAGNVLTSSPIYLDTTGVTSAIADKIRMHSILVVPTATAWEFVLHDTSAAGKVVARALCDTKRSIDIPMPENLSTTLYLTTLTNCVLLIYRR